MLPEDHDYGTSQGADCSSYLDAITGPPPCEMQGGCPHFNECASNEMACFDFLRYTQGKSHGAGGNPLKEVFAMLYDIKPPKTEVSKRQLRRRRAKAREMAALQGVEDVKPVTCQTEE